MISAASAPWLQPPDFLGAMKGGASAGADLVNLRQGAEKIAQAGQQAADDLAYRYAALSSQDQRAQAEQQAQKEHLTAAAELKAKDDAQRLMEWQTEQSRKQAEDALKGGQWMAEQGVRTGNLDIAKQKAAQALLPTTHSGEFPLIQVDKDGNTKVVYTPPAKAEKLPPPSWKTTTFPETQDIPANDGKHWFSPNEVPTPAIKGHPAYTLREPIPAITALPNVPQGTAAPDEVLPANVNQPKIVVQGGNRFQVNADGSSSYLGPAK